MEVIPQDTSFRKQTERIMNPLQLSGCQALMAGKEGPSQSFNDQQGL